MRHRLKWALLGGGLLAVLLKIVPGIQAIPVDGLNGLAFAWFDTTVYAPGYTHSAFAKVQLGMSQTEVEALLGKDLCHFPEIKDSKRSGCEHQKLNSEGLESWRYSGTPTDSHYRVRMIHFKDGLVVGKFHELYFD